MKHLRTPLNPLNPLNPKLEPGQRIKFVGPGILIYDDKTKSPFWSNGGSRGKGTVTATRGSEVQIERDERAENEVVCFFHRRQVTHVLRPKQKPEKEREARKENWWVRLPGGSMPIGYSRRDEATAMAANHGGSIIYVCEVRPGEVVLGREELARAWNKEIWDSSEFPCIDYASKSDAFERLMKALGLGKDKA